jgi:hypothetical protein
VSANGLTVVAPGLPEAEVTADGAIVVTLLRAVGWLARFGLRSRMQPAGPLMPVEGAQMLGPLEARLSLFAGVDPERPRCRDRPGRRHRWHDAAAGARHVAARARAQRSCSRRSSRRKTTTGSSCASSTRPTRRSVRT